MALADELEAERSALTMIDADPFNAEAPPEALESDITPTLQHYVRSNFPVPAHDGRLEISGAVEHPYTLTLEELKAMPSVERVVTLECAGNGRLAMRPLPAGEPWGNYAVSTATMEGRAPARNSRTCRSLSTLVLRCCSPAEITGRTSSIPCSRTSTPPTSRSSDR